MAKKVVSDPAIWVYSTWFILTVSSSHLLSTVNSKALHSFHLIFCPSVIFVLCWRWGKGLGWGGGGVVSCHVTGLQHLMVKQDSDMGLSPLYPRGWLLAPGDRGAEGAPRESGAVSRSKYCSYLPALALGPQWCCWLAWASPPRHEETLNFYRVWGV